MIIEETRECNGLTIKADRNADLKQFGEWIQIDKDQARQLIEALQKWVDGEEIK
ncbi:hypothetical protein [Atlantibacter hermannii]|uniref:hypothetical protein n=1 Tax=Atlantibacter hermannii TaxID=565 RepID=UPI0034D6A86C